MECNEIRDGLACHFAPFQAGGGGLKASLTAEDLPEIGFVGSPKFICASKQELDEIFEVMNKEGEAGGAGAPGQIDKTSGAMCYAYCTLRRLLHHREGAAGQHCAIELPGVGWAFDFCQKEIEMGMLKEFKEFAMRGNVVDMAAGIIIGSAFGQIVNSLVKDVFMPPIGWVLGNVDFSSLSITLMEKTATADAVTIRYGAFINTVVNFVIVAFVIFIVVRQMNRMKRLLEEPQAATTRECPRCCSTIPIKATRCPHCTSELQAA